MMLKRHRHSDGFLEDPVHLRNLESAAATAAGELRPGQMVGAYRVLEVIGKGGMGVVYRAEQKKPRRIVALKVIRPGVASEQMLRRFEFEAHVLGRLHHPGVAQVHEAGTADTGYGAQPFFAMEYIEGVPLNEYSQMHKLEIATRLELMAKICEAVHHAHQNGVIHRDLKPGNILVGESRQPKVLDFGVARAIDADIQVTTIQTYIGQLVGTIPYMSPEQALGNPEQLDTRSDVYALGVLCYELVTGKRPYDLNQKPVQEALRTIIEDDPTPMSSVNKVFHGDIDTIVSKALEKERDRRYQSALDLAHDIRRYLRDEPITAHPASALYQLRKFAKRNKALVRGVAGILVALMVGLAVSVALATTSRNRYREIIRLADIKRLEDAKAAAEDLWPASSGNLDRMQKWLAEEAYPLRNRLPLHEKSLAELGDQALDHDDALRTWKFANVDLKWRHDTLRGLVADLKVFTISDSTLGTIASVEKRFQFAKTVRKRTITGSEASDAWKTAIADITRLPVYRGRTLTPQEGLLPLDRNPESGLWEFWHVQTGARPRANPAPNAYNRWLLTIETGLVFVLIPEGTFWMGSQKNDPSKPNYDPYATGDPNPMVELSLAPFFLSKYEMTQGQWERFTGRNPSQHKPGLERLGHIHTAVHPVELVSWKECDQVLQRLGLVLPTEAQWEYAARGGTNTPWWTGNQKESVEGAANLADLSSKSSPSFRKTEEWLDDGYDYHAPVGSFRANGFGLHDVMGNVWEWCRDWSKSSFGSFAPGDGEQIVADANSRVMRGGSWDSPAAYSRSEKRGSNDPELIREPFIGLRPARRIDE